MCFTIDIRVVETTLISMVLLTQRSNNHDEYDYLINSCLEHFPRMASKKENIEAEHVKHVIQVCAVIVDNALADILANSSNCNWLALQL